MNVKRRGVWVLALLALAACETGWDLEGEVLTDTVGDKSRQLFMYVVSDKVVDPESLPSSRWLYDSLKVEPTIPEDRSEFVYSDFGCHEGSVVIVAWAPREKREVVVRNSTEYAPDFQPAEGDFVASSDVRRPRCGWKRDPDHVTLVLTDAPFHPKP
jgi:hypothetical protein